jgi:hypothetical protein
MAQHEDGTAAHLHHCMNRLGKGQCKRAAVRLSIENHSASSVLEVIPNALKEVVCTTYGAGGVQITRGLIAVLRARITTCGKILSEGDGHGNGK